MHKYNLASLLLNPTAQMTTRQDVSEPRAYPFLQSTWKKYSQLNAFWIPGAGVLLLSCLPTIHSTGLPYK